MMKPMEVIYEGLACIEAELHGFRNKVSCTWSGTLDRYVATGQLSKRRDTYSGGFPYRLAHDRFASGSTGSSLSMCRGRRYSIQ